MATVKKDTDFALAHQLLMLYFKLHSFEEGTKRVAFGIAIYT
jgi:prophage maintenance system killer protein